MFHKKLISFLMITGLLTSAGTMHAENSLVNEAGTLAGLALVVTGAAGFVGGGLYAVIHGAIVGNLIQDKQTATISTFDWNTFHSDHKTVTISKLKSEEELQKNEDKIIKHSIEALKGFGVLALSTVIGVVGFGVLAASDNH